MTTETVYHCSECQVQKCAFTGWWDICLPAPNQTIHAEAQIWLSTAAATAPAESSTSDNHHKTAALHHVVQHACGHAVPALQHAYCHLGPQSSADCAGELLAVGAADPLVMGGPSHGQPGWAAREQPAKSLKRPPSVPVHTKPAKQLCCNEDVAQVRLIAFPLK